MPLKEWFIHIQGETIGPLATQAVASMLRTNRLQYVEFAWTHGLSGWVRITEIDEFNQNLPVPPKIPIPDSNPVSEAPPPAQKTVPEPAKVSINEKKYPQIRKFVRVLVKGKLETSDGKSFKTVNLGEGGIFLESDTPPALGTDFKFRLSLTDLEKPLDMTGVVIRLGRAEDKDGFAIEFTRVNPAHKRLLLDLIRKKNPTP